MFAIKHYKMIYYISALRLFIKKYIIDVGGENMLDKLIPSNFSGVVSVLRDDQALFRKAYEFADIPNQIPNDLDTKFATASAGKAFVAAGIMKLIEDGKLSLQTHIGEVLSFDLKQIDPDISVRQLLNHTSGIPDYFDEAVMAEYADLFKDFPNYKIRSSKDLLPLFIDKPMMYAKGEKFQYNNTGYVVLGLIIESITEQPFDIYLDSVLFSHLSMDDTGYYELDRLPAKCANSYIFDELTKQFYTNIYSVDAKGTGAGGAFTTVPDIENFWRGLISGEVISKEMFAIMTLPQTDKGEYGYGFWLSNDRQSTYFQGSDPGVSFISSYDAEKRLIITIVSNLGQDVWAIHKDIKMNI